VHVLAHIEPDTHPPSSTRLSISRGRTAPAENALYDFLKADRRPRSSRPTASTSCRRGRAMTGWLGPEEWQAVALSLRVAFWATALSLPFGILVAYALARWTFPGRRS
jgi:ABC-type glycerol-3-phosphate transport system permease component